MSDRELLELAAKAAGIQIDLTYTDEFKPASLPDGYVVIINDSGDHSFWNPLTDDGDALRLAVKLRISPDLNPNASTGVFTGYELVQSGKRGYHNPIVENFGDDDLAATRRAIVRRAAAIGKSMATAPEARN